MTITQQRATLQTQIWKIANDVRGAVDGWGTWTRLETFYGKYA